MSFPISRLLGSAPSQETVGWGTSLLVHAAGAVVVWATCSGTLPNQRPKLLGNSTRIELVATWVEREQPSPAVEIVLPEPQVVVMPARARIAERQFSRVSTDVSQPTPTELEMANRLMALPPPPAVQRRTVAPPPDDSPRVDTPPTSAARRHKSAEGPTGKVEVPAGAAVRRSSGMVARTVPYPLNNRPPTYPIQAEIDRLEGTVILRIHVSARGRVVRLEIVSSSGHRTLDAAAARAVRSWRFAPARDAGRAVAAVIRQPVRFALD